MNNIQTVRGKYFEISLPVNFSRSYAYEVLRLIKKINLLIDLCRERFSKEHFKCEFEVLSDEKVSLIEDIYPKVFYIYVNDFKELVEPDTSAH